MFLSAFQFCTCHKAVPQSEGVICPGAACVHEGTHVYTREHIPRLLKPEMGCSQHWAAGDSNTVISTHTGSQVPSTQPWAWMS